MPTRMLGWAIAGVFLSSVFGVPIEWLLKPMIIMGVLAIAFSVMLGAQALTQTLVSWAVGAFIALLGQNILLLQFREHPWARAFIVGVLLLGAALYVLSGQQAGRLGKGGHAKLLGRRRVAVIEPKMTAEYDTSEPAERRASNSDDYNLLGRGHYEK